MTRALKGNGIRSDKQTSAAERAIRCKDTKANENPTAQPTSQTNKGGGPSNRRHHVRRRLRQQPGN